MSKVCDVATAVALIKDRQTVASTGVIGWLTPDVVLKAIGDRFDETGSPQNLTFYFPVATGDSMGIPGMEHVAKKDLLKRVVSGNYINPRNPATGERPALMELIQNDLIEAYAWPIGATMHWLREVARRSPGYMTRMGLDTYIDPRNGGGKLTRLAEDDLVERIEFRGEDYLFYPTWPLDVGILRASSADELGNLSFEDQPLTSCSLALALAVKACGGKVIAQVSNLVPRGSRSAHEVRIPGVLVDHVVVAPDEPAGTEVPDASGYLGPVLDAVDQLPRLPPGPFKVIARRIAREVRKGETAIFGFGAPTDAVLAMAEDGMLDDGRFDDYVFTTEHGPFGGAVMGGWQFSANFSPKALLDGVYQFDFINGGGCELAALAFAQIDAAGNINVTQFGTSIAGGGGFTDIAQNAKRLVFAGTLTADGLIVECEHGGVTIVREGRLRKLVPATESVTYRAGEGVRGGQVARVITERAVFDLLADGLVLIEIAPGVDLQRDVLDQIGFPVRVAENLAMMDERLFRP